MKCIVFMAAITMAAMLFSTHLYSQNNPEVTFRGTVVDSLTGKPLPEVIINRVCQEKKGMTVKTYLSDNEGRFNIAVPRNVPSRLEFSFLGYKVKVFSLDKYVVFRADEFKLGNMEMVQDVSKLDEIVVKARMEMYKIKGDTVVFFPRAVKTMHGDPVLEVLRRMPGVSISGNTVTIGGETVSRTYVNGKLIFGEDVMKPLTEIAADEASQIYAYDEDDEKKQILYGKNAKKRKVLNVVTFEKFNSLSFGRLIAEGGLDSKKDEGRLKPRYDGSAEIGLFSPELRLGAMIQSGNLNDYSSMKASGGESRNEFGYVSLDRNFSRNKMICVDYNYSAQRYDDEQRVVTDYYPTEDFASQTNSSKNMSASRGANHDIKIRYENTSGKSSLRANLDMAFSKNAMLSESLSSVERDGSYMLSNKQYYNASSFGYTLNPYLYYSRKAGENSYSIRGSFVYSNNNGSTVRRDTLEEVGARRLLGLSIDRGRPKISGSSRFEWIWNMKKGNISPNIKVSYSSGTESEMAVDLDSGEKNTYYSGDMDVSEAVILPAISGTYSLSSKTNIYFDLAYKLTMFNLNERLPYERTVKKFFHALEPRIAYYWKHGEISGLTVRIDGLQSIGSYRNYGEWINDSNPMFITTGNPELRPSTSYSLSLSERIMTKKSFSVTFVGRVSPVFNPVITDRTYYRDGGQIEAFPGYEVSSGATVSTFVNGSMAWNYALGVELESNIVPLSSILKFKADYNYRESETSVNSVIGKENSNALLSNFSLSTNFSSRFRLDMENKLEYRVYVNSSDFRNSSFYDRVSTKIRWDFYKRLNLECSYVYEYYLGRSGSEPLSGHFLNASVGVFLFKDRNARLAFNAKDILNNSNYLMVSYADQYVMNTYSKIRTGCYTISFVWHIRKK